MKIMPSFQEAAARLIVADIKSFSDCSIGDPDFVKKIERYHQHVDRVKRSRYSVKSDPKARFLFFLQTERLNPSILRFLLKKLMREESQLMLLLQFLVMIYLVERILS